MKWYAWQRLGREIVPITGDSCFVIINIVSPNGLGWKPKGVAAAEAPSTPPRAPAGSSRLHSPFPLFLAGFPLSLRIWPQLSFPLGSFG